MANKTLLEKEFRPWVRDALFLLGYKPITQTDTNVARCPDCGKTFLTYPKKGRPDILVLHPTKRSIVVEVKRLLIVAPSSGEDGKGNFAFSEIDDSQRRWLTETWMNDGGLGFIALGVVEARILRALYMIPWDRWLAMEKSFKDIQDSIPWCADDARSKVIREYGMDVPSYFNQYAMVYKKHKVWELPPGHTAIP